MFTFGRGEETNTGVGFPFSSHATSAATDKSLSPNLSRARNNGCPHVSVGFFYRGVGRSYLVL